MSQETSDINQLELEAVIGLSGNVNGGFHVHPGRQHFIYPLGSTLVIENIENKQQCFLAGHTNDITCVAMSKNGQYIASGQATYMGFKAEVIVWDFSSQEIYAKFTLHKVKVESIAFSPNNKYLATLGGEDDGSVVVWSLEKREAICGSPAQQKSSGISKVVKFCNTCDELMMTGGADTLRVWELDVGNRKIWPTDVTMGQLKRIITSIEMSPDDSFAYCGTTTGDIIVININSRLFQAKGPEKKLFSLSVTSVCRLPSGEFIIGAGDGTVTICKGPEEQFKPTKKSFKVEGAVTSISLRGGGAQFYVATSRTHIYQFTLADFSVQLLNTCHHGPISGVAFPRGTSDLFGTCGYEDIRIWHLKTSKELLRISVPNMHCNAMVFTADGKSIVTGWDDGRIRTFFPESGKLHFMIDHAHSKGVTAIAATSDGSRIISGGGEGQVRIWDVESGYTAKGVAIVTKLREALKEHSASVSAIKIRKNDRECVTASADGSCIVWDLQRFVRSQVIFANTLFRCVSYRPDECQIIASGTDRKIGYWETYDGALIRQLDGSGSGAINGLDIAGSGNYFASGGDDRMVKVWRYNEGDVTHVGLGHSKTISCLAICPSGRYIISCGEDGSIYRWRFPFAG